MRYLKFNQIKKIIVSENATIKKVLKVLNETGLKIVFVVDKLGNLLGIVNDGDLRRYISKKNDLTKKISLAVNYNFLKIEKEKGFERKAVSLIKKHQISGVPIFKKQKLVGLYTPAILEKSNKKIDVVIMAGGKGKRLLPLTIKTPKALLKYKNKPLIKHVIDNCKHNGFNSFIISVNYLGDKICKFFKKSEKKISFIKETSPLGTIGSLKLINDVSENFLVFNCDVVTNLKVKNFFNHHVNQNSLMTIGVKKFNYRKPYGEIEIKNNKIKEIHEKPVVSININTGIYAFNKKIIPIIKKNKIKDIIKLINFLKKKNIDINTFLINENWNDVGQKSFIKKLEK